MRLPNIDFLKGLLIILVIVGHILTGSLQENFARYLIYSFHMPLFIGISGYLFNRQRISSSSFVQLFHKYKYRVLIPWIIAVLVFIFVNQSPGFYSYLLSTKGVKIVVNAYWQPFYHLWFVPAFLSWIIYMWLLVKKHISVKTLLLVSGAISLIAYILNIYPGTYQGIPVINHLLPILLHTFRPYFLVFFVIGSVVRSDKNLLSIKFSYWLGLLSFAIISALFLFPFKSLYLIFFYLFNLAALHVIIYWAKADRLPHVGWIEWIGRNSFGIYLWHVIPLIMVKRTFGTGNLAQFYFFCFVAEFATIWFIYLLSKNKPINKFLFGSY